MRKKIICTLIILGFVIFSGCKHCKEGENRENRDVAQNVKATVFQFPEGTRWVFKSNGGEMDTVFLGAQLYSYRDGYCKEQKYCCTKIFVQEILQDLHYREDADGLDKFKELYFPDHYIIGTNNGNSFEFSNPDSFDKNYKESLVVNSTLLNDVQSRSYSSPNLGDVGVDAAYWSLSKGLVRYDYQKVDGSFIIYERQDF